IEFARCHLDDFDDGVYFVDLAPVTPGAVVGALAAALPLMVLGEQPLLDMIVDWIGDRRSLLVVDNCEHLVAEVVGAIEELITRCWNLKVLATSREALRLTEERVYCVPSLEAGGPALELFCERARAVDASFAAEGHVDALVRICERLDGIPLAIELAAARVRSLSVDDLLDRVDDRFRFLRGRTSAMLDRHHTLWDTISWSYQLLTAEERVLFDRASVFAGGFDLHAAEAVCGFDPIDAVDIFELVSSLVDKSMIVADRGAIGMRYRQLETLRQYAEEQLEPRGETALLRDRHAAYVADLAAELDLMVRGPHQIEGEDRMALEWDNIRAAHTWSLTQGDLERAQRLVEATFQCSAWGMGFEHVAMLQRTVQLGEALGHPSTTMLGMLSYWTDMQGNGAEAQRLAQRGLDVAPAPDHPDTANCWWALCAPSDAVTAFSPEAIAAFRHQTEAVANTPDLDRNWWALVCLTDAALNSDRGAMGALLRQLDEIAARVQCPRLSMMTRLHEGHAALEASAPNFEAAMSSYKDAAVIARATADRQCLPLALRALAIASTGLGAPEAVATCHDSLEALFDVRHWQKIWQTLEAATLALARAGRTQQAAEILGCLDARSPGFGIEHALHFRDQARQLIESAGGHDAAQLRGARMSPDEVVTTALAYCSDNG
ncbi:MAG TPA: hypothetical protein VFS23_31700, partial [Vicinamibacterales bacterium]|nr:hypothetical protein [Vicinamibacterales bacterium]